jgi:RNA polymerase sigma-70 factor (family 1)
MALLRSYSDEQLLVLLKSGDEVVFTEIYDRYWELLYNTAYKHLKDEAQCREIVHDVLLDLWQRRASLQINDPQAYMKTAVRFRVINYVTRRQAPAFLELFDTIAASPYQAEHKVLESDLLEMIESWIESLPSKRRTIFIRHFFEQHSVPEIAHEMGISTKTVHNQVGTSLQYLRTRFGHLLSVLFSLLVVVLVLLWLV